MLQEHLRNIAIIAHVDHGKTTLVDSLLKATHAFREGQKVQERVLDSNDQERERGITILAKNISIEYRGVKINVIDTPGHADFGGEVERVLKMADGALLLVDAYEGPMPQTRFVLRHAIDAGLSIMIVINKIDRDVARPQEVVDDVLDLMLDLGATDEQLDFAMEHIVYTSAVGGYAYLDPDAYESRKEPANTRFIDKDGSDAHGEHKDGINYGDMYPLLDMIIDAMPMPDADPDGPLAMQCVTIDHSDYVGRIAIGRIWSGTIHKNDRALVIKNEGEPELARIKQLFTFNYLGRIECMEVAAGDIVAIVGIEDADIGDVYTDPENPVSLPPIEIEPPTMAVVFEASTSPLVGREGTIVGGRQLKQRLMQEKANNPTMHIKEQEDGLGIEVAGRGVLHLSVLMEEMRREGFEFQVGRPQVLLKDNGHGEKLEPIELAVVECPDEYSGKVIELFGNAGGLMVGMESNLDHARLDFHVPTRGLFGLKNKILNVTHGEGIFYHSFLEYGEGSGDVGKRPNGAMISMATEKAVAYALGTLQERGAMFVAPGDDCYEGMLVGERSKPGDMVVNVARTKRLGNQRASTADIAVQLTPPRTFSLEEALEYVMDDELVEITPKSIRMRKRLLSEIERRKVRARELSASE